MLGALSKKIKLLKLKIREQLSFPILVTLSCFAILIQDYVSTVNVLTSENRKMRNEIHSSIEKMIEIESQLEQIYQVERNLWKLTDPSIVSKDRSMDAGWVEPAYTTSSLGHLSQISVFTKKVLNDLQYTKDQISKRKTISDFFPTEMPVLGLITSQFGYRQSPFATRKRNSHKGIDIAAKTGSPIFSAGRGIVRNARYVQSYGNFIDIDHGNGMISRYAHASRLMVRQGDFVKPGQLIAKVGSSGRSTGPHLHFEILLNKEPVDPENFLFVKPPYAEHLAKGHSKKTYMKLAQVKNKKPKKTKNKKQKKMLKKSKKPGKFSKRRRQPAVGGGSL